MQKHATRQSRKTTDEQPEAEAKDLQDEQLAQETDDLLDEIECCLAEVEKDDLADKKAAKAEWDEILRQYRAAETTADETNHQRYEWAMKYDALFEMRWCCDIPHPDFGELE